jgi:hypothetical protein
VFSRVQRRLTTVLRDIVAIDEAHLTSGDQTIAVSTDRHRVVELALAAQDTTGAIEHAAVSSACVDCTRLGRVDPASASVSVAPDQLRVIAATAKHASA